MDVEVVVEDDVGIVEPMSREVGDKPCMLSTAVLPEGEFEAAVARGDAVVPNKGELGEGPWPGGRLDVETGLIGAFVG